MGRCSFDIDVPAKEELPVADDKVPDDQGTKTTSLGYASLSCGLVAAGCYTFSILVFVIRPSFPSLGMAMAAIFLPIAIGTVLALVGSILGMVALAGKEDPDEPTALGCFLNVLCIAVLGLCLLGLVRKPPGRPPTPEGPPPNFVPWPGR
jgi:hypothetical protein